MGIDAVLYEAQQYDFALDAQGDIETADQLETAILMSLFCEKRAAPSEVPNPSRRRGWIGNVATPGIEIGSKLWLYEQARVTRTVLNGIQAEGLDAVNWLVEDGIASRVDTNVTTNELIVDLYRPNSEVVSVYYPLWQGTGT